jgi:hypothetical protein
LLGTLYVDVLFVEENHGGEQLGSFLPDKVEAEAKSMGATLSHLEAFDWQAKDFTLSMGMKFLAFLRGALPNTKDIV